MWLASVSLAHAAPLQVEIAGVAQGAGVVAIVRSATGVVAVGCADDGVVPDAAIDGRWTCALADVSGESVAVSAVVDGSALEGGILQGSGGLAPSVAALQVARGVVTLSGDPSDLSPVAPSAPSPAVTLVVVRVIAAGTQAAPVVTLTTVNGSTQLACRDDGRFPDVTRNDAEPACAGSADDLSMEVGIQTSSGKYTEFGRVEWASGPIHYVTLDVAQTSASTVAFPLALPLETADDGDPTKAGRGDPPPSPSPNASPGAALTVSPTVSPGGWRSGIQSAAAGLSRFAGALWLLGFTGIVTVAGLGWRRAAPRRARVQTGLRRHPSPQLLAGGPSWAEPAAVLETIDPVAFAGDFISILARERRVVLVLPAGVELPAAGPCSVWVATIPDWAPVLAGVVALADTEGPELAVLVVGADTLLDAGAVAPGAVQKLMAGLPAGVWLGVVTRPGEHLPLWLPQWAVSGPPWVASAASKS